jgi:hypothetical protein
LRHVKNSLQFPWNFIGRFSRKITFY